VANGISEEYGRPVFLWGREGNMSIKGSVRSGSVHALELMSATADTFVEFGGHAASGGFTVAPEAIYDFEDRLVSALDALAEGAPPENEAPVRADALITPEDVTPNLFAAFARLAPFGMGNEKPVFCIQGARIARVGRFGKNAEHLRLAVTREGSELGAIAFFVKGMLAKRADALTPGASATLYAHLERDTFTRGQPIRLRLLELSV
jgi:single-stranded-DNA-specific exonuclease